MRIEVMGRRYLGLLLALAAGVTCAAPIGDQIWMPNGEGSGGLIVRASVRAVRAGDADLLQQRSASVAENDRYARFLRTYYDLGRRGDRDSVAKLFAPHMRASILARYPTPDSLREEFSSLNAVHLKGELYWGSFALAYVEHELKTGSTTAPLVWIHTILCTGSDCMITDNQEVTQIGGIVLALYVAGAKPPAPSPNVTNTRLVLVAPARENEPKTFDSPIVVDLPDSDDSIKRAATQLVERLTEKLPDLKRDAARKSSAEPTNSNILTDLYAGAPPANVNVFDPPDQAAMYTYTAFQSWYLQRAPWKVRRIYSLGPDLALGVLGSVPNGTTHLMLFRKTSAGWRIESDATRYRTWAVLQSASAYRAFAGMH
jgi:hypothetical protein